AAYVPMDPAYPPDRLAFMITDARVELLVTTRQLPGGPWLASARVLYLEDDQAAIASQPALAPSVEVTPDHLAYVIYTSGSTGAPKGVAVSHGNVLRLLDATASWFHFDHRDVWTMFHSFAFDFSVWEIWGALGFGGRLVVVSYWVSRSPEAFHALL